jgi:hypothetical protein
MVCSVCSRLSAEREFDLEKAMPSALHLILLLGGKEQVEDMWGMCGVAPCAVA